MKYVVVAASFVLLAVGSGSIFILSVALQPIVNDTGWTMDVPSTAYGLQFVGGGAGALFVGRRLDLYGMGLPATVGSVMIALGALLTSQVTAPWQLWLTHGVLLGLFGQATLFAPLLANVTRWFGAGAGWAVGLVSSGQSFAGIVWPYLAGDLIETAGWREAYLGYAIIAAACMLPASLAMWPEPSRYHGAKTRSPETGSILAVAKHPTSVILSAAILCCCIAMSMPLAHLVAYGNDLGIALPTAASALSIALGCAMFSRLFILGWASRTFGGIEAILGFSGLQAVSIGLLLLAEDATSLFSAAVVFGFGYGGLVPSYPIAIRDAMPSGLIGRATTIVFLAGALAMGFGGWIAGIIREASGGYEAAFLFAFASNLLNILVISLKWRSKSENY